MKSLTAFIFLCMLYISGSAISISDAQFAKEGIAKLKFQRVQSAKISKKIMGALKKKRPGLLKALRPSDGTIRSSAKIALFKAGGAILVVSQSITGRNINVNIPKYEEVPVGMDGDNLIVAICQCQEGRDDCEFERLEDGSLGECFSTEGECSDCRGGFEVWGPDGNMYMSPF